MNLETTPLSLPLYLAVLPAVLSYLFGSVPYGFLLGKILGKDLRREGSGNIGATNAVRVLGKKWGYLVFFLDFLKGFLPVLLFRFLGFGEGQLVLSGLFVILGHNFPVWLKFKGGKGIASSGGVILALFPPWIFVAALAAWVALFFGTRYVSLASIGAALAIAASACTLSAIGSMSWFLASIACAISLLGILRHRANISRLLAGTEPRFSKKPKN